MAIFGLIQDLAISPTTRFMWSKQHSKLSNAAFSWPLTLATSSLTPPVVPAPPPLAEQWGRRWITIDTSRVALALARARIMGARYPFYLLADSPEGRQKEAELSLSIPSSHPTGNNINLGFVYQRAYTITLESIANNAEIDVIWEKWQTTLEPLREQLNTALGSTYEEWQIPREAEKDWPEATTKTTCRLVASPYCPAKSHRHPSPPRPITNTSTTNPMRTRKRCGWPARSLSRAFRPAGDDCWRRRRTD